MFFFEVNLFVLLIGFCFNIRMENINGTEILCNGFCYVGYEYVGYVGYEYVGYVGYEYVGYVGYEYIGYEYVGYEYVGYEYVGYVGYVGYEYAHIVWVIETWYSAHGAVDETT